MKENGIVKGSDKALDPLFKNLLLAYNRSDLESFVRGQCAIRNHFLVANKDKSRNIPSSHTSQ